MRIGPTRFEMWLIQISRYPFFVEARNSSTYGRQTFSTNSQSVKNEVDCKALHLYHGHDN